MDSIIISDLRAKLAISAEALRRAEERAIAGQLALELMHEIKNPLEALGHLIYLAFEDAEHPDEVRRYMGLAQEQMATLSQITSQTLGLASASHAPRPTNLVLLAEAALRIHQRKIEAKKVHLIKDLPEVIVAEVYTGEILQVISNLVVNALDALPAEGTLSLRLRRRHGEIQFLIADNGHGIPAEYSDEIFQPFFTTKQEHGTGLGLALSTKIIERHHGKIAMRSSTRPGKSGTTFRVSLPI